MVGRLHLKENDATFNLAVLVIRDHRKVVSIVMLHPLAGIAAEQHLSLEVVHSQIGNHMLSCTNFSQHCPTCHDIRRGMPESSDANVRGAVWL
jgi:hypothetical protein